MTLTPWKESYDQPRQHIKKQTPYFANTGPSSQSYGFSSSHVWMWELDHKEGSAPEDWCFCTVVLEKTFRSPLDCKEMKRINCKGIHSWIIIARTDAEAPILWPPDGRTNWERPWHWERLKAGGERDDRGWGGWMASLTQWIWVWASSGRWWRTGKPDVLHRVSKCWIQLSNWTTTKRICHRNLTRMWLSRKQGTKLSICYLNKL